MKHARVPVELNNLYLYTGRRMFKKLAIRSFFLIGGCYIVKHIHHILYFALLL